MVCVENTLTLVDNAHNRRVLYRAFGNSDAYLDDLYTVHRELYADLPVVRYEEDLTDDTLFEYCRTKKYYTLILPYTDDHTVVLERSFGDNRLSWMIMGGGVKPDINDNYVNAVERLVKRYVQEMRLGEIEPVAFLENTFRFGNEQHRHLGIAFVARIRDEAPRKLISSAPASRVFLVPLNVSPGAIGPNHHREVFAHAKTRLAQARKFSIQEEEIATNARYQWRYKAHAMFIKPLFSLLSKAFYDHSIDQYKTRIEEICLSDSCSSLLDVACGENFSSINLARDRKLRLVVGNDISWSQVEIMKGDLDYKKFRNSGSLALFTNHDARRLPFSDKAFDCVICQNVLHHMPDQESVSALVNEVKRVGKRALIVEVLDPHYEGLWGRLRHWYYLNFLKDAGTHFLSREEFEALTRSEDRLESFEMRTVRGTYQFAQFGPAR